MNGIEILGFVAATLTTAAYIPQVIRTIKTKSTEDLSLAMFSMMFTGMVCWMVYGFLIDNKPLIIANIIASGLSFIILFYKLREVFSNKSK
jgi:MtN3 and saliva related transmembrane protein